MGKGKKEGGQFLKPNTEKGLKGPPGEGEKWTSVRVTRV